MAHVQFDSSIDIFSEYYNHCLKLCTECINTIEKQITIKGLSIRVIPGKEINYGLYKIGIEFAWNGKIFTNLSVYQLVGRTSYRIDILNDTNKLIHVSDDMRKNSSLLKKQILGLLLAELKKIIETDINRIEQIKLKVTQLLSICLKKDSEE